MSTNFSPAKCGFCAKETPDMKACSKCHLTPYCSKQCQRKDWNRHKQWCDLIQDNPSLQGSPTLKSGSGGNDLSHQSPGESQKETAISEDQKQDGDENGRLNGDSSHKNIESASQKKKNRRRKKQAASEGPVETSGGQDKGESHGLSQSEEGTFDVCSWCQKYLEEPFRCSGCKKAKYCSEKCQKKDWERQHKAQCDRSTPKPKRNGTTAATPEKTLHEKTVEPPVTCSWCQKFVEEAIACEGCSKVIYCSGECKNKDWFYEHQKLCDGKENRKENLKAPSTTVVPSEQDTEASSKDRCRTCKKKSKDVKSCARCKEVRYCSKSCQRLDWPRHKEECVTVDGIIKTKEYKKAVEEEARQSQRQRDIPISPLEAMAHMMGLAGRPQQEVQPRMSWIEAKRLTQLQYPGYEIIYDFDDLPGEFLWMIPVTRNKVLLAYIARHHHHFARHAMYIRDSVRQETTVMFYLDYNNPLPYFSWNQVVPGNFICIRNAIFHNFMDGTVGIRVDEAADVTILC